MCVCGFVLFRPFLFDLLFVFIVSLFVRLFLAGLGSLWAGLRPLLSSLGRSWAALGRS